MAFEKGKSGNPKGRPKLPIEYRGLQPYTRNRVCLEFSRMLQYDLDDLKRMKSLKSTTTIQRMVIAIMLKGIQSGDYRALDFMLDRIMGKSKQDIDLSSSDGTMSPHKIEIVAKS
jgi:hypothetical protein